MFSNQFSDAYSPSDFTESSGETEGGMRLRVLDSLLCHKRVRPPFPF